MCLYIKFWLASFNFIDNQIVSIDNRQGPYKSINFIGNPKIIIYIPRFNTYQKKKTNETNKEYKIYENIINDIKNDIKNDTINDKNVCDIYINISY